MDYDYDKKIEELKKYIPVIDEIVRTIQESKRPSAAAALTKMQYLRNLLVNGKIRMNIETLCKCEKTLKNLQVQMNQRCRRPVIEKSWSPKSWSEKRKMIIEHGLNKTHPKMKEVKYKKGLEEQEKTFPEDTIAIQNKLDHTPKCRIPVLFRRRSNKPSRVHREPQRDNLFMKLNYKQELVSHDPSGRSYTKYEEGTSSFFYEKSFPISASYHRQDNKITSRQERRVEKSDKFKDNDNLMQKCASSLNMENFPNSSREQTDVDIGNLEKIRTQIIYELKETSNRKDVLNFSKSHCTKSDLEEGELSDSESEILEKELTTASNVPKNTKNIINLKVVPKMTVTKIRTEIPHTSKETTDSKDNLDVSKSHCAKSDFEEGELSDSDLSESETLQCKTKSRNLSFCNDNINTISENFADQPSKYVTGEEKADLYESITYTCSSEKLNDSIIKSQGLNSKILNGLSPTLTTNATMPGPSENKIKVSEILQALKKTAITENTNTLIKDLPAVNQHATTNANNVQDIVEKKILSFKNNKQKESSKLLIHKTNLFCAKTQVGTPLKPPCMLPAEESKDFSSMSLDYIAEKIIKYDETSIGISNFDPETPCFTIDSHFSHKSPDNISVDLLENHSAISMPPINMIISPPKITPNNMIFFESNQNTPYKTGLYSENSNYISEKENKIKDFLSDSSDYSADKKIKHDEISIDVVDPIGNTSQILETNSCNTNECEQRDVKLPVCEINDIKESEIIETYNTRNINESGSSFVKSNSECNPSWMELYKHNLLLIGDDQEYEINRETSQEGKILEIETQFKNTVLEESKSSVHINSDSRSHTVQKTTPRSFDNEIQQAANTTSISHNEQQTQVFCRNSYNYNLKTRSSSRSSNNDTEKIFFRRNELRIKNNYSVHNKYNTSLNNDIETDNTKALAIMNTVMIQQHNSQAEKFLVKKQESNNYNTVSSITQDESLLDHVKDDENNLIVTESQPSIALHRDNHKGSSMSAVTTSANNLQGNKGFGPDNKKKIYEKSPIENTKTKDQQPDSSEKKSDAFDKNNEMPQRDLEKAISSVTLNDNGILEAFTSIKQDLCKFKKSITTLGNQAQGNQIKKIICQLVEIMSDEVSTQTIDDLKTDQEKCKGKIVNEKIVNNVSNRKIADGLDDKSIAAVIKQTDSKKKPNKTKKHRRDEQLRNKKCFGKKTITNKKSRTRKWKKEEYDSKDNILYITGKRFQLDKTIKKKSSAKPLKNEADERDLFKPREVGDARKIKNKSFERKSQLKETQEKDIKLSNKDKLKGPKSKTKLQKNKNHDVNNDKKLESDCSESTKEVSDVSSLKLSNSNCKTYKSSQSLTTDFIDQKKDKRKSKNEKQNYDHVDHMECEQNSVMEANTNMSDILPLKLSDSHCESQKSSQSIFSIIQKPLAKDKNVTVPKINSLPSSAPVRPKFNIFTDKSYCFLKNVTNYSCRMCSYEGNTIVKHIKKEHPHFEIPLSRMSLHTAIHAIRQAKLVNFFEIEKKAVEKYVCRFCWLIFEDKNESFLETFFWHVVRKHTGEFEQCSECPNLKQCTFQPDIPLPPKDKKGLLMGYACSKCYFTQISEKNVINHIKLRHKSNKIKAYKISLSNIPKNMLKSLENQRKHSTRSTIINSIDNVLTAGQCLSNDPKSKNLDKHLEKRTNHLDERILDDVCKNSLKAVAQTALDIYDDKCALNSKMTTKNVTKPKLFQACKSKVNTNVQIISVSSTETLADSPFTHQKTKSVAGLNSKTNMSLSVLQQSELMDQTAEDELVGTTLTARKMTKAVMKYEEIQQNITSNKSQIVLKSMMNIEKLANLFKCASRYCSFTSNSADSALLHASTHQKFGRVDALCCAYCSFDAKSNCKDLVSHVFKEHGVCRYFCKFCFYRGFTSLLVERHFTRQHGMPCQGVVLQTSTVHKLEYFETEDILSHSEAIRHYACCIDKRNCKFRTFIPEKFCEHLIQNHPESTVYYCHECRYPSPDPLSLIQHMKSHGFNLYQCTWCDFGAESESDMLEHASIDHPFKPPRAYLRHIKQHEDSSSAPTFKPVPLTGKIVVTPLKVTPSSDSQDPVTEATKAIELENRIKHTNDDTNNAETSIADKSTQPVASDSNDNLQTLEEFNSVDVNIVKNTTVETEETATDSCQDFNEFCDPSGLEYMCPLCEEVNENMEIMRSHLFEEFQYQKWGCSVCSYKSFHTKDIKEHTVREHRQKLDPMVLQVDNNVETWVAKLLEHQENIINRNRFNLQNENSAERNNHANKTSKELEAAFGSFGAPVNMMFSCPKCDFKVKEEDKMYEHLKEELTKISWCCSLCPEKFHRYYQAQNHRRSAHSGTSCTVEEAIENPEIRTSWVITAIQFQKDQINSMPKISDVLSTENTSDLQKDVPASEPDNSLLVVDDEEMFHEPVYQHVPSKHSSCSDSKKKKVTRDEDLKSSHKNLFQCDYCSFTSTLKIHFCDHLLRHYNLKPYNCAYCDFNSYIEGMQKHQENVHPEKPRLFMKTVIPDGPPEVLQLPSHNGSKKHDQTISCGYNNSLDAGMKRMLDESHIPIPRKVAKKSTTKI